MLGEGHLGTHLLDRKQSLLQAGPGLRASWSTLGGLQTDHYPCITIKFQSTGRTTFKGLDTGLHHSYTSFSLQEGKLFEMQTNNSNIHFQFAHISGAYNDI